MPGMPAPPLTLPEGYAERPLSLDDAAAVAAVMAAAELADTGEAAIEEADIVGDWSVPSYDVAARTVGVVGPTGDLVAYAEVAGGDRGDAAVHPDHRGLGLGTALAHWMQQRAKEDGSTVIGMPVPAGSPGDRLLEQLGYRVRWTSWVLALPEGAVIPERPLPEDYAVREATPADHEACWRVIEDAFLEWSDRDRTPLEDWLARITGRPTYSSWNLRVVTDPAGEVVGACVIYLTEDGTEGYVDKVATRSDHRGRGLAQALLADAFAVARAHGATRSTLATDTRTGALALYEKLGMVPASTWVNRAIDL
jgi:GNAT superfamily N-acetyltransferase